MKTSGLTGSTRTSRRWLTTFALVLPMLSGCDAFWKPCSDPDVMCLDSMGELPDRSGPPGSPGPSKSLGPPRQFEWRASLDITADTLRFVGMKGTAPVFLGKDGNTRDCKDPAFLSHWVVPKLDLLNTQSDQRIITSDVPVGCPNAPCLRFKESRVLVSNNTFYFLAASNRSVTYLDTMNEVISSKQFQEPPTYFRSPTSDGVAVNLTASTGSRSNLLVRWNSQSVASFETNDDVATAIVLGDLDAFDSIGNGIDAILFQSGTVQRVWHQGVDGSPPYTDETLKQGLQSAVNRLGKGQAIGAGFITDLNQDGYTDLVLAFGSSLYVTSYLGRDETGIGKFRDWPQSIATPESGVPIRSVMAVNLVADAAPELVVETDKAVHFYLNKP